MSQRFEFEDLDLVMPMRARKAGEQAKTGGDIEASPALIPITKPAYARHRAMVAESYPHLVV